MAPARNARADKVKAATAREWRGKSGSKLERRRGGQTLVFTQEPDYILNAAGDVVGVDAWVELYDAHGREIPIDPHRRIINPPTVPRANVPGLAENPLEAFWEAVWDSVDDAPNPGGWRTRGTVTTVYGSSADGAIATLDPVYATARAGSSTVTPFPAAVDGRVGQVLTGGNYECRELFISFDISAVPNSDTKTDIQLSMWLLVDGTTTSDFTVEARQRTWTSPVSFDDWVAGSLISGFTLLASMAARRTTGAYYTMTSQSAFLTSTVLDPDALLVMLNSSRHRVGNTPTGEETVRYALGPATGTTTDPKLVITHAGTDFSGGSEAQVVVTSLGGGQQGGSQATVTAAAEGAGSATVSAGSQASITVTATGAGSATVSAGSQISSLVTATGAGSASLSGGSTALVTTAATGSGTDGDPIAVDITITIGPTRAHELATVGLSRAADPVGATRQGLNVGPSRTGLSVGPSRTQRGE